LKQNESNIDRTVRAIVGVVLLALGLFSHGSMTLRIILDILGAIALFTGLTSFCPLCALFHFTSST
jgi:hypothetical protein